MISRKFDTIIEEFSVSRGFTDEETQNFKIYVTELFQTVHSAMKSKQYDFIIVMYLGTFFLKVWAVHKKIVTCKLHTDTGLSPTKNSLAYRRLLSEKIKMEAIYKRMTENFLKKKLKLLEYKEERQQKKIGKRQMMEMIMDDVEDIANKPENS